MKKILITILVLSLACSMLLAGCKEEKKAAEAAGYTLTLSEKTAQLQTYGRLTLAATVTDSEGQGVEAPALSWSSSDPAVARVTDGVVIAGAEGQAEITARLESGELAVCKVTVENKGMVPQLVLPGITDGQLTVARGQAFHLDGMVTFGGADCTDEDTAFTYQVADPAVATVSEDGEIRAVAQGTTQLTVTAAWRGLGGQDMAGGQDGYGLQLVIELTVVQE